MTAFQNPKHLGYDQGWQINFQ